MDIQPYVRGSIQVINPDVAALLKVSTGYTTAGDGSRTPTYDSFAVSIQVQALTYKDLQQLEGINENGAAHGIYFTGDLRGILRPDSAGGDILTISSGIYAGDWLVIHVLETWALWSKAACVRQTPPS